MADFSAYPALEAAPAPNMLDMAGKAAQLNQTLLANTGMGLEQHYKRMQGLTSALQSMYVDSNGKPLDRATVVNGALDAVRNGLVGKDEAASFIAGLPTDPGQVQAYVRQTYAGVQNNAAALGAVMQGFDTGAGQIYRNTNPLAAGGNQTPAGIQTGLSASENNASAVWYDPQTGKMMSGTVGQRNAAMGADTSPQITETGAPPPAGQPSGAQPIAPPSPIAAQPVGESGPQIAQATLSAIGQPAPNPLTQPKAAPGAGGQPFAIDPKQETYQDANAKNFQTDVDAGTGPQMQTRIDNLKELAGTIDGAWSGAAQDKLAYSQKLAGLIGLPTDGATESDIMHKLSMQAASYLPGSGQSDAARAAALGMTPNGDMTKDAIRTTTAMVLGKAQYDAQFAKDALAWKQSGGDATNDYASFKAQYGETHPGPMLYAIMAMRETGDTKGFSRMMEYIKGLPANERAKISAQIGILKGQMNGGQ